MGTAIICIILVIVCVFGIKSYCKKLANGCCGSGDGAEKKIPPVDGNPAHYPYRYELHIDGMSCKNCARRIQNAFHKQDGFYAAVDFRKKTALVRTKQPVEESALRETVTRSGYSVTEIKQTAPLS